MDIIIGVDIGTSGTKAIAFKEDGEVLSDAYVSYDPIIPATGYHELDPEELLEAVCSCLKKVILVAKAEGAIAGISFSSAMHGLIAVDVNGNPLTNMITWADLRSARYADILKSSGAGKRIYQATGTPVYPMSPLCKLLWLKEQEPGIFARAVKFISIKEYVFYKFFGQYLVDHSIASGTGLFDIRHRQWFRESLDLAGIHAEQLSVPVSTGYAAYNISKDYAAHIGLDSPVPFIAGASDGVLANLGSNAIKSGDISITIGTSGAVRMATKRMVTDPSERIFNYILSDDYYVAGGPVNNGISLLKWYAGSFLNRSINATEDIHWFIREAGKAPAGCDGLIFLPYIQGERAPVWDPNARGVFAGIHAGHNTSHFMRAIIEGINYSIFQVAGIVEDITDPAERLYASGGFTYSRQWLQWMADLFGKPLFVDNASDASARGAALLGLQALGIIQSIGHQDHFSTAPDKIEPDMAKHGLYQQHYPLYSGIYACMKDTFMQMNTLRSSR